MNGSDILKRFFVCLSAVILICICVFLRSAHAQINPENARELSDIQRAIKGKKARWIAAETSVSKLPHQERKRLCGTFFTNRPMMGATNEPSQNIYPLGVEDSSFDWRDIPGVITPIKNQGSCGSCWAFSAVGAMESLFLIHGNPLGSDLSEQFVVSCDSGNYGCCGGFMNWVYDFLSITGTTDDGCFTYNESGSCKCNPVFCRSTTDTCDNKCMDWEYRLLNLSGWEWIANDPISIKAALIEAPVPCGMTVYTDFYYYAGGIYEYSLGNEEGKHSVIIVGWGTDPIKGGYWIVKNSWGTDWGEDGYFKIYWGNSDIGTDAGKLFYPCPDLDEDDYEDASCGGNDCNDNDPAINPDAIEACGDGLDNNCSGEIDEGCVQCIDNADCADNDSCTMDSCVNGSCMNDLIICDDGDPCTTDFCVNGGCVFETKDCDDGDPCTTDSCTNGNCENIPINCDDSNPCTNDYCLNGTCYNDSIICNDGDPCTIDSCDPSIGCKYTDAQCGLEDGCCPSGCDSNNDSDCLEAVCGDGYCSGNGEDCHTCPQDCKCVGKNCSGGCCGNGICEENENQKKCPADCS